MYLKVVTSLTYLLYVKNDAGGGVGGGYGIGVGREDESEAMNFSELPYSHQGTTLSQLDREGEGGEEDLLLTLDGLSAYCDTLGRYPVAYLCLLLVVVAVGLSVNLFVLVVISSYPDLYTSKQISQAYTLVSNMVSLASSAFIVLSSFVPSENSCSLVLVLTFSSTLLFLLSEATLQTDFYTAIIFPFWHEHHMDGVVALRWCAASAVLAVSATAALYATGPLSCADDARASACPLVPIFNMAKPGEVTLVLAALYVALFVLVALLSLHIFFVVTQKLKANKVGSAPTSYGQQQEKHQQQQLQEGKPEELKIELRKEIGTCSCHDNSNLGPILVVDLSLELQDRKQHQQQLADSGDKGAKAGPPSLTTAFTKSFRLTLLDLVSHLLLVLPAAVGPVSCYFDTVTAAGTPAGGDYLLRTCDHVRVSGPVRVSSVMAFALFRCVRPILLMRADRLIWKKVGDIVREDDDEEDAAADLRIQRNGF